MTILRVLSHPLCFFFEEEQRDALSFLRMPITAPSSCKDTMNFFRCLMVGFLLLTCGNAIRRSGEEIKFDTRGDYWIGTGIYDMTGPAAQINLMGYAKTSQTAHGIHQRLRARAFVVAEKPAIRQSEEFVNSDAEFASTSAVRRFLQWWFGSDDTPPRLDPSKSICFVSIDAGMGSDLLNAKVLERLQQLLPPDKLLCGLENLSISGTHTHSAPAGFLQYAIFQFTSLGFSKRTLETYVEGVAQALVRAHDNLQTGHIRVAQDFLWDANINRSPSSYLLNPLEEREEYGDQGDTDKTMLQLTFDSMNEESLGVLNWFAVHGTSMNSSNQLISGDNKGYASYLMEKKYNGNLTLPGQGSFVAAFASTNLGDVSPNTAGPRCIDSGLPCDMVTSTCHGEMKYCVGFGPGKDMIESTEIIGRKQFDMAVRLKEYTGSKTLRGEVSFRHSFVDFAHLNVTLANGTLVHTCPAALGYSFAAGTTDGAGDMNFRQGTNTSNPFWDTVSGFLSKPSKEQMACHFPKPILLNVGPVSRPYSWEPRSLPISIFRVGQLFILNVPSEFTTMAGRRLRKAVRDVLISGGIEDPVITIAGLANSYSHYVTTFEEYGGQRYEAASTLFGPHTLSAYIQEFRRLSLDMLKNRTTSSGTPPPDLSRYQLSFLPPVELDTIGAGLRFGSVAVDARDSYVRGKTVAVSFHSANPRNDHRIEGTFLTVDALDEDGQWQTRHVDGDWCTKYRWKGGTGCYGESFAEIHWDIPESMPQGLYRICHFGTRKTFLGGLESVLVHSTNWLVTTFLGTPAATWILSSIDAATTLSPGMKGWLDSIGLVRLREFQGCSKTFLVHNK